MGVDGVLDLTKIRQSSATERSFLKSKYKKEVKNDPKQVCS